MLADVSFDPKTGELLIECVRDENWKFMNEMSMVMSDHWFAVPHWDHNKQEFSVLLRQMPNTPEEEVVKNPTMESWVARQHEGKAR